MMPMRRPAKSVFTFKMRASGVDKETKQPWQRRPPLFDAKRKPLIDREIGAGSEIKVAFTITPFYTSLVGAGVALRLEAVQVIKLVQCSLRDFSQKLKFGRRSGLSRRQQ